MATSLRTRVSGLAAAGLLVLTACGGSDKPKPAAASESANSSSSAPPPSPSSSSSSTAAAAGTVEAFAGNGEASKSGDVPGPALKAGLDRPENVAVTDNGDVYIADNDTQRILLVHAGTMTVLYTGDTGAGESNTYGLAVAPDDTVWFSNGSGIFQLEGTQATKVLNTNDQVEGGPYGLAFDSTGNLFIAEQGGQRVKKYDTAATVTLIAGTGEQSPQTGGVDGGQATASSLGTPTSVAVDKAGNVYVAENFSERVRKITPDGTITTFAGGGTTDIATAKDGIAGTDLLFNTVDRVASDKAGNIYVSDHQAGLIVRFDAAGTFEHVAGSHTGATGDGKPALQTRLDSPGGMTFDTDGTLYFVDALRIRRITGVD